VVHISLGGGVFRVKLSNEFGLDSLQVGGASIALVESHIKAVSSAMHAITFGGRASITIPPGAFLVSDPILLNAPSLSDLAVNIFVPSQMVHVWTRHDVAQQTNFKAAGNQTEEITAWYLLKAVDVEAASNGGAIAALGDSITDGVGSTRNANKRWPNLLAERLQSQRRTRGLSVIDLGISGNRILHDGTGVNMLARLDRDVLTQSGVKFLIVLEGINDIGRATREKNPDDIVSAGDLAWGLSQLAERAHQFGIKVFVATLTPVSRQSSVARAERMELNRLIRSNAILDGVVEFDGATQDPTDPAKLRTEFDCGDGLHPSDAGYAAMARAIDQSVFKRKR
jgi:lysophospholipase L1-like esterase